MISKKAAWEPQAAFFIRGEKSNKNKIDEDPKIR